MAHSDDVFLLVRERIDTDALVAKLKAPEDGAVVVFDGFVRNNFKGQRTLYLEYESYEAMAYAKIREIGVELHQKFPIHRAAVERLAVVPSLSPVLGPPSPGGRGRGQRNERPRSPRL